jgi:adenosylmethionine-8-amino-7-oxononanoate aminotransferase
MAGIELVRDKTSRERFEPSGRAGALLTQLAFERGLICRTIADTLALAPPLCITRSQVDDLVRILGAALDCGQEQLLDYL